MGKPQITAIVVQQLEVLRQTGNVNIASAREVKEQAGKLGLGGLWDFMVDDSFSQPTWSSFTLLRVNYKFFIEQFGVKVNG